MRKKTINNVVIRRFFGLRQELEATQEKLKALEEANKLLLDACEQSLGLLQAVLPKFDDVTLLAEQVWEKTKRDLRGAIKSAQKENL